MSKLKKILIINTGGTFNKVYDPLKGELVVEQSSKILEMLSSKWLCEFEVMQIIGKDSLHMNNHDRLELLAIVSQSDFEKILIIHGTDSMSVTANYLADADLEKQIVFTGAMIPYSIDPVEATANLAFALGNLQGLTKEGIYIAMHGLFSKHDDIKKDRKKGRFIVL